MVKRLVSADDKTGQLPSVVLDWLQSALAFPKNGSREATARGFSGSLEGGKSTAYGWIGDSTGDSPADGSGDRFATQLTRNLSARYPGHHVIQKTWSDAAQDFQPWETIKEGANGRQYLLMTAAPAFWTPSESVTFATDTLDVRSLVAADTWTGGPGNYGTVVARKYDANNAALMQFAFHVRDNGQLNLSYSTNGTSMDQGFASTASVPSPGNGQPLWVRFTLRIIVGTSVTVTFYSSNDGVAWSVIGQPVQFADPNVKALASAPLASVWLGADGLVQNAFKGKLYEVQIRDGLNGPLVAPAAPHLYSAYVPSNAADTARLQGSPTLYAVNGSRSGGSLGSYFGDATRLRKMSPDYGQELVFFNTSHNDGEASPAKWTTPYRAWVNAVIARLPLAAPVAVAQNPHDPARWALEASQGDGFRARVRQVASMAARHGWGLLDLDKAFRTDPRGLGVLISSDGLHPAPAGYVLGGQRAAAFVLGD